MTTTTDCTYDVRHQAKRLLLQELGRFLLAFGKIDGHECERDVLLLEHNSDALGAGGNGRAVESQDHFENFRMGFERV